MARVERPEEEAVPTNSEAREDLSAQLRGLGQAGRVPAGQGFGDTAAAGFADGLVRAMGHLLIFAWGGLSHETGASGSDW